VTQAQGQIAKRLVADRLRAALPPVYRLVSNVAWLGRTAAKRGLRDGEADIVLAHPDRGFLVFEVKSGEIARGTHGRWYADGHELRPNPFEQATTSVHALMSKLAEQPDAPRGFHPIAGHAVALPDVDLASAGDPAGWLRVVSWNCQMALGRKASRLLALRPDIAIVPESAEYDGLDGLVRIGWTGADPRKGLGVFARADFGGVLDQSLDRSREWYLPISFPGIGLNILAAWAMHARGGEASPTRGRIHRTLDHYGAFLSGGRTIIIGDLNDNVTWDTPGYPSFWRTSTILAHLGLANVYYTRTGEQPGAESIATFYQYRHRDKPYFVDHAFVPDAWLPRVRGFEIGRPDDWLDVSDHMPMVLDLDLEPASRHLAL
jgi:exodeoxyribonuclease-3